MKQSSSPLHNNTVIVNLKPYSYKSSCASTHDSCTNTITTQVQCLQVPVKVDHSGTCQWGNHWILLNTHLYECLLSNATLSLTKQQQLCYWNLKNVVTHCNLRVPMMHLHWLLEFDPDIDVDSSHPATHYKWLCGQMAKLFTTHIHRMQKSGHSFLYIQTDLRQTATVYCHIQGQESKIQAKMTRSRWIILLTDNLPCVVQFHFPRCSIY